MIIRTVYVNKYQIMAITYVEPHIIGCFLT